MRAHQFQDALTSSTKVFGRKEVRVVFAGSGAHTDGETVVMPSLPSTAEVNQEEADVMRGYRSHEAMHVRITDTSPEMNARLGAIATRDPFAKGLVNICEDIRIEGAGVAEYPGMARDLSAVNVKAAEVFRKRAEEMAAGAGVTVEAVIEGLDPKVQFSVALSALGRKHIGVDTGWYEELLPRLRQDIVEFARKAAAEAAALPTGINARGNLDEKKGKLGTPLAMDLGERLADDLAKFLQDNPPPPPPPPPPSGGGEQPDDSDEEDGDGQGAAPEDGDDSDGSGDGDGDDDQGADGDGDGGDGGDGDGGDGDGKGSDSSGDAGDADDSGDAGRSPPTADGDGSGGSGSGGLHNIDIEVPTGGDALQEAVSAINERAAGGTNPGTGWLPAIPWRPFSSNGLRRVRITPDHEQLQGQYAVEHEGYYASLREMFTGHQAMIRRVLEQELQARQDRRWQSGFTSGRLNQGRVADAVLGAQTVYRQREDGRDMDTLLQLHVDCSGSMSGRKMRDATQLAIALCDALERTGCEIGISTWAGAGPARLRHEYLEDRNPRQEWLSLGKGGLFTSLGAVTITDYKMPKQRLSSPGVRAALGLMSKHTFGGTPLVDAVLPMVTDMARQRHGKRILVVMTDGEPDGVLEGSSASVNLAMEAIHKQCQREGVHIIGVGIGVDVSRLFADSVVTDGADTYAKVMTRIAKYLRQERSNALKHAA